MTDPINEAEGKADMQSMAAMTRAFYDGLREAGFTRVDSLRLTREWIRGITGRPVKDDD